MSLTEILNEALDALPGARFAGVVSTDGLSVEMLFEEGDDEFDIGLAELELGTIAASATAASRRLGSGNVQGLTIESEQLVYVLSLVSNGYFAAIGAPASADLGQARQAVRRIVDRIGAEL
jgi:predicted regulator of Ras-like GTPase activity (Roadblock/LC7/MglB family)